MITNFKKFETNNNNISFIPNDLVIYYENKVDLVDLPFIRDYVKKFFQKFLIGCNIHFYCIECTSNNKNDWYSSILYNNKEHKGIVKGYGLGINNIKKPATLNLSVTLKNIRHEHLINTYKPITIYSDLPDNILKIIEEINLINNTKKYNL